MINFDIFKKEYKDLTEIELFNEEGELQDFYRKVNTIEKPVCGLWHANPMPLTAVKKPFCGIATVDITVVSHPDVWQDTRDKMNTFAATLNGTSREVEENGIYYSVSYNCQTCSVGNRILDANIGHGEVFELRQQISFVVIESGVSAYDTTLYIDGLQIPFLSLVENKIHTTSNIATETGVMQTASEAEAYGIDFVIPYMRDDASGLVRDVIDRATGNEAHCVVLDIAGEKHCHIMQFTHVSANVQPPQNIGMNVSMTELDTVAAKWNGMWEKETANGRFASVNPEGRTNAEACVIFWGDGESGYYALDDMPYHVYPDDGEHEIIIFKKPRNYYLPIEQGKDYFGKPIYFRFAESIRRISINDLREISGTEDALFGNKYEKMADITASGGRLYFTKGMARYYIDTEIDGTHYIANGQKVQCLVDTISYINGSTAEFVFTSVWEV